MKTIIAKKAYFFFLLMAIGLMPSCVVDDDDDPDPASDRDKFIGTWNVNETCSRDSYTVEIQADPSNSSQVIIKNFWLIGYQEKPPYAIVTGSVLTIPEQAICDNYSNEVKGSGTLNKDQIVLQYSVNDGADLWSCTATYTRAKN
ncbi:MAG: hypothetical protein JXA03_16310 [Bacteroidales bacterium]|nr:hypothetical protein [Bacteroidales bacterium]